MNCYVMLCAVFNYSMLDVIDFIDAIKATGF